MKFSISYIVVTKNRLPFLKILFEQLLSNLKEDEEVVVVDGNSTDGSREFLQNLFNEKKIHQFISEADRNQAHGWNKAMLMAKGIIIKKIIDDDVHDYDAIRNCRDYMLKNPETDVCISNSLQCNLTNPEVITTESRLPWFLKWKSGAINTFSFGDVHMLIRRSSLSYIGLYDTQFKMMDWEYSLRISFLKANIAYYTGCNSLSVATPGNVSSTATKKLLKYEGAIGKLKYNYPGDGSEISLYSHIKIAIGKFIYRFKNNLQTEAVLPPEDELVKLYNFYYQKLKEHNSSYNREFID